MRSLPRPSCGSATAPGRASAVPAAHGHPGLLHGRGGKHPALLPDPRHQRPVEAIAKGQDRVLAGHGHRDRENYTAFQIIWRLWKRASRSAPVLADRTSCCSRPKTTTSRRSSGHAPDREPPGRKVLRDLPGAYQAISGSEESKDIFKQFSPGFFDLMSSSMMSPRQRPMPTRLGVRS